MNSAAHITANCLCAHVDKKTGISIYPSLKSRCKFLFHIFFPAFSFFLVFLRDPECSGRPCLLSVLAASPLTAAVSCGLALNCAPATVNVYVYQSNAMCLCYMALWTRRLSKTHRLEECGPRRGLYGPLSIWEKWSASWRRKVEQKSWFDFVFGFDDLDATSRWK